MISVHLYIFRKLSYFKALSYFKGLSYFQSDFIFKALSYFHSSFITFLSKRFYFLSKALLFIFSKCESALFIFFFQEQYSALL
jgi:hypothetical protein